MSDDQNYSGAFNRVQIWHGWKKLDVFPFISSISRTEWREAIGKLIL